jgi:hypothetical protein
VVWLIDVSRPEVIRVPVDIDTSSIGDVYYHPEQPLGHINHRATCAVEGERLLL